MDVIERIRALRRSVPAPTNDVVERSRVRLLAVIAEENTAPASPEGRQRRERSRARRIVLVGAAATVATAVVFALDPSGGRITELDDASAAATELRRVAVVATHGEASEPLPIRHIRFRNLTDTGAPVYDVYIRPDGTAMVGRVGAALGPTDGFLESPEIASLNSSPEHLRQQMLQLAARHGFGTPGERAERSLYRLATELLPDPALAPPVRAAVLEVLASLDLEAINARTLGKTSDPAGRQGIALAFTFEEGTISQLVLDETTGQLLSDTTVLADGTPLGGRVFLGSETTDVIPVAPTKAHAANNEITFAHSARSLAFKLTSCTSASDGRVTLSGKAADGTTITVTAADMAGGIAIQGPGYSFEGTIHTVSVGDTGRVTVKGRGSVADDSTVRGASAFTVTLPKCG